MKSKLKAEGIPFWITLLLMLIVVFGFGMGVPALLGQGLMETHTIGWGGRQLGIAVGSILAILLRNPVGYVIVFTCHAFKETGDLIEAVSASGPDMATLLGFALFIGLELVALWYSYKALRAL